MPTESTVPIVQVDEPENDGTQLAGLWPTLSNTVDDRAEPTTPGAAPDVDGLRADLLAHLTDIGLAPTDSEGSELTKPQIRRAHSIQRAASVRRTWAALHDRAAGLIAHFAVGSDIVPERIDPVIEQVSSGSEASDLFRLGTLLWSVPVSPGYGRRMRFLVRDRFNGKLIGLLALGDPVFNLRARDNWIGWDGTDRRDRLVNVMDAYVAGAVPPYSHLLAGKLVVSLIASTEVAEAFEARYGGTVGIISGKAKGAHLALVTVSSALGRSSLYNRLRLFDGAHQRPLVDLVRVGFTQGYGHFQLSDDLFARLRGLLAAEGHPYANGHRYGTGPNWRMRVVRVGLARLGLSPAIQRHGIGREVFAMLLAPNAREFLRGDQDWADPDRPTASAIGEAARNRWIVPRAERFADSLSFTRADLLALLSASQTLAKS